MAGHAELIAASVEQHRVTVPTLAIGAYPIGDGLHAQLLPFADDLAGVTIDDCGHAVPLDRPQAFLAAVLPFLA